MTSSVMTRMLRPVRFLDEPIEVGERSVGRMNVLVVGDVVAIVRSGDG